MKATRDEALLLLAEHGERLYSLLVRLTLRTDVADDLLQDLYCKLVQDGRYAAAANPLGYAMRMAANLAFDHRRARQRVERTESAAPPAVDAGKSPLLELVHREELDQLLDVLGQLPAANREIVVLRYLEQHDYETIGRMLGKTAHQVRGLCHKAIGRLRELLDVRHNETSTMKGTRP